MNRFLFFFFLGLLSLGLLNAQDVLLTKSGDSVLVFVAIPFSLIKYDTNSELTHYQLHTTIHDKTKKILNQETRNLYLRKEDRIDRAALIVKWNYTLQLSEEYYFFIQLRNTSLGDKYERKYYFNTRNSAKTFKNLLLADTGEFLYFPSRLDQTFKKARRSFLYFTHTEPIDSIALVYFNLSDEKTDHLLERDTINNLTPFLDNINTNHSIEIHAYYRNLLNKYKLPLYQEYSEYNQRFSLRDQIEQIKYIASQNEWKKIKDIPVNQLYQVIDDFWELHNTNPNSSRNETRELFYSRVLKAEELFSVHSKLRGWKSDRGRVFIKYGQPDEIIDEVHPLNKHPYIRWYYYKSNTSYLFIDKSGYGNYKLYDQYNEN